MLERSRLINPFDMTVSFETGRSFQKSSLELNYTFSYNGKNRGLQARFFAGTMLKNNSADPFYAFSASGRSGSEQYLYQGLYPDRFSEYQETFWSRQMTRSEGNLVTPVNKSLGYSRWLCSLSITSSLPGKTSWIPVKPFANVLLNDHGNDTACKSRFFFETGLKTGLWNVFEVYIPLLVSDNIGAITGSFKERIRFVFKLDIFNSQKKTVNQ
jgi:hypothetical protein